MEPHRLTAVVTVTLALAAPFLMPAGTLQGAEASRQVPERKPEGCLHFKPRDHTMGDVHPFFENGECFLYYLKPAGFEPALVRSRDLVHWTEAPLAHAAVKADDWMSPWYVLGVFRDPAAKVYRSFYGHARGRMASSASTDLLRWECAPKEFSIPPADDYVRRRDPFVFWNPETSEFGCVMTTQMKGQPKDKAGAISHATSPDLKRWQDHGPLLYPGDIGEPECPQMFRLGGRWYLLASIHDRAVGRPTYWQSQSASGPWAAAPAGVLDGKDLCAAQIGFDGDTPVLLGWIPLTASEPGKQHWGGHVALPREVRALSDGKLASRLHPGVGKLIRGESLLPRRDEPLVLDGLARSESAVPGDWSRIDLQLTLEMSPDCLQLRLRFPGRQKDAGAEIVVDRKAGILRVQDPRGQTWNDLPITLDPDTPAPLRAIIEGDIVETFLCDSFSLAARLPAAVDHFSLSASAVGGTARVRDIQVWNLRRLSEPRGDR